MRAFYFPNFSFILIKLKNQVQAGWVAWLVYRWPFAPKGGNWVLKSPVIGICLYGGQKKDVPASGKYARSAMVDDPGLKEVTAENGGRAGTHQPVVRRPGVVMHSSARDSRVIVSHIAGMSEIENMKKMSTGTDMIYSDPYFRSHALFPLHPMRQDVEESWRNENNDVNHVLPLPL
ncbi:hypothetical protein TNCV_4854771 [Trichonephila clavipes]|nr:hypothetical protein TNCV_4854771 [Trichonephila clavipes]